MRSEFLEARQQTAVSSGKHRKRIIIFLRKKTVKPVKNMKIHEQLLNNKIKTAY